ncbi:MAG: hypothetical protein LBG25_06260 [Spirochaetaceae bacterium]|jgi:hypothetical protein|nr:hypothetical protein [Spirochaetaceae bacterium]
MNRYAENSPAGKPAPHLPQGMIVFIMVLSLLFFSCALKEGTLEEAPILTSARGRCQYCLSRQ